MRKCRLDKARIVLSFVQDCSKPHDVGRLWCLGQDAGTKALDGGLHGWLSNGHHDDDVGFPFWPHGWQEVGSGWLEYVFFFSNGVSSPSRSGDLESLRLPWRLGGGKGELSSESFVLCRRWDDAYECFSLLKGVVVVLLYVSGLWVKTFVHWGLNNGNGSCRSPSEGHCWRTYVF